MEERIFSLINVAIVLVLSIPFFYYILKSRIRKKSLVSLVGENFPEIDPSGGLYSQDGLKFMGFSQSGDVGFVSFENGEVEVIRRRLEEVHDIQVYVNDFLARGDDSGAMLESIRCLWKQGPRDQREAPTLHIRVRFKDGEKYVQRKIYAIDRYQSSMFGSSPSDIFLRIVNMVSELDAAKGSLR